MGPAEMPSTSTPAPPLLRRMLGERPDETVLRFVFRALLGVTVIVLGLDLGEQLGAPQPSGIEQTLPGETPASEPFLPSTRPDVAPRDDRRSRAPERAALRQPMTIELVQGGRLELVGTISPGTAERFRAELDKRGGYVTDVVLNSPGGSVSDALAMARLIRDRKLATRVEASGLCASSCPLILAGGITRTAVAGSLVGVHQVYAAGTSEGLADSGAEGMARAQRISAECQRHLVAMGVDPRVWVYAMETPPQQLFYLKPSEMAELKLTTPASERQPAGGAPRTRS